MSDSEKAVRAELDMLGVTRDMQRNELPQGVRSPLLGTYRILMHRHTRANGDKADKEDDKKIGTEDIRKQPRVQQKTQSRTCNIL